MNIFFIQRSKEEYERASIIINKINNNNVKNFITHLVKSMEFLSDGIIGEQIDMFDINMLMNGVIGVVGNDFLEFYFYLFNLLRKDFNFISNTNIIVAGRKDHFKLGVDDFHDYLLKVRNYFNKAYDFLER